MKLCVFDLDGTLLNNYQKISKENIDAVNALKEAGYMITIATGRLSTMTKVYQKLLTIDLPIVSCNGAIIVGQGYNYKLNLSSTTVNRIVSHCKLNQHMIHIYSETTVYSEEVNGRIIDINGYNKSVEEADSINFEIVESLDCVEKEIFKVLIPFKKDTDSNLIIDYLNNIEDIVVYVDTNAIEIVARGASKGNGIRKICDAYGIALSHVIAFGDGNNDISLFEIAGKSIAMGNGSKALKEVANHISETNVNHGVAYGISKWLLERG